jgi:AbrB family looped-hinge helix DNA binding protein
MASSSKQTTVVSTKGQVILPKVVRQNRNWGAGTRLVVEETAEGVLLRAAPLFAPTTIDEVFGSLKWSGPAKTIEEMDQAVLDEARRQHDRD